MSFARAVLFGFTLLSLIAVPAFAQERPARPQPPSDQKATHGSVLGLLPPDAVSEHNVTVGGKTITYTATAGTLDLFDQSGERTAAVFYAAYVKKNASTDRRPVTFVFNGGPGAASAYLHLGLVGPKVLEFGANGRDGANARLRDNPETWLEFTDLVLIDPIGTGWSRAAKPDESGFWGVRQDAQTIAKTVALYVARNSRSQSPKYLLGESYGGLRAVKVARVLQEDQGIVISGIVMVSPLIDADLLFVADRFALGAALQLPSLAAAELERRHAFSTQALAEAERFAMTDYLTTLAGPAPQGEAAKAFYTKVAQMTGLPLDVVEQSRGMIRHAYVKHLRQSDRDIVSAYDASFASPDPFPDSDGRGGDDPMLDGFTRALGGAFVGYARDELGFKTEMTYTLLSHEVNRKWDWHSDGGQLSLPGASGDIRELLALNPSFKLLVAHGYSDVVIPYSISRYVFDHMPPIGAPGRLMLKLYPGGHMLYLDPTSRATFTGDVKKLYEAPNAP